MSQQLTLPDLVEAPEVSLRDRRIAAMRQRRVAAKIKFDRAVILCNTQAQKSALVELQAATLAALRGRA